MSISDRLRSSSSISRPLDSSKVNAGDDVRVVTGIALSCDDMCVQGDVRRDYKLYRGVHRAIDLVRGSASYPSGYITLAAGGAARASFSSPVMSRKHARVTFAADGSVTVMDVGSMHGTYVNCGDSEGFLPEILKPRRHYTLRSGDTIVLGKVITRDGTDWKPVAIRVTFTYDAVTRVATPPPNRYGMFLNTTGASEPDEEDDEDVYSVSSSSDGEEDDKLGPSESSPENSPVRSHVPLSLGLVGSAAASHESLVSGSRSSDDINSASGVFDVNRSISARNALRAILPPIPKIQSAIRRLPSLRELGLFGGFSTTPSESNDDSVVAGQDGEASISASAVDAEKHDTTTLPPISAEPPSSNQGEDRGVAPSQLTSGIEDGTTSASMFAWQEPSHPQNQLGLELELDEQNVSYADQVGQQDIVGELQDSMEVQNSQHSEEHVDHQEKEGEIKPVDEEQLDDVKSMDISPVSSREGTPTPDKFRASAILEVATDGPSQPAESDEQYCRCHEQIEHQQDHSQEGQVTDPTPMTPQTRRTPYVLTPVSAAQLDIERRRSRLAMYEGTGYDVMPSPVSISKERKKRVCARVGPTRRSPAPNPPGPFGRVKISTKRAPDVDALRAKVRSLESRMHEIQGSAIMMASATNPSTSASVASVDEAKKEMESLRDEMRRLSGLMETLVAKIEARTTAKEVAHTGSPMDAPSSETTSQASRKRKRTDDLCTLGMDDMISVKLSRGLAEQVVESSSGMNMEDRIKLFRGAAEEPDVRPAKRARTADGSTGKAIMTVASAAGYASLGAALTWVMLAYVL